MNTPHSPAHKFMGDLDQFLRLQFAVILGQAKHSELQPAFQGLLRCTERHRNGEQGRAASWAKWHDALQGSAVTLFGFPELAPKHATNANLTTIRQRLSKEGHLDGLVERLKFDFERLFATEFLALGKQHDRKWLVDADIALESSLCPKTLARKLLELGSSTSHQGLTLTFHPAPPPGRFLMVRLHGSRTCLIGHPTLDALFRLSGFAHEVGHVSEYRSFPSLEATFEALVEDDSVDTQEVEAYRYEKMLMDLLGQVLPGKFPASASALLATRKSIQCFDHLLYSELAHLFFSGSTIEEIESRYIRRMTQRGTAQVPRGEWTRATDLSRPLDRAPYRHAMKAVYL